MNPKLENSFEKIEAQRQEIMALLTGYSYEQLNQVPAEGQWSVTQVLWHLIVAEQLSFKSIKKRLSRGGVVPKTGLMTQMRSTMLRLMLMSPIRFKAPGGVAHPENGKSYEESRVAWEATRMELKEWLEALPDDQLGSALYTHPKAGKMSIVNGLDFFYTHSSRHAGQIRRTLEKVSRPIGQR